jgi:hypothetical protein
MFGNISHTCYLSEEADNRECASRKEKAWLCRVKLNAENFLPGGKLSTGHHTYRESNADCRSLANFISSCESRRSAGELIGVNQRPAMGSFADLDALIVDGGYGKSKLVVINF